MNKNFKIGIITMHRVRNNGSALQAFALQKKLKDIGFDSELIDYIFPNKAHIKNNYNLLIIITKKIKHFAVESILGFPNRVFLFRLNQFYKKYFVLSSQTYACSEELHKNPPQYDFLITGSDQVWNHKHIGEDTTFMLSFCPDNKLPRISYASSFAANSIPDKYKSLYAKFLSTYNAISVRESSGIKLIKDIVGKEATVTCDPTLLLNKVEWSKIAETSKIKIKQPYILAYILTYAYNPYPEIDELIRKMQKQLGLHVVFLNGKLSDYRFKNSTIIRNAGPCEFVRLFMDASYVITTSFHGTAFALNLSVPIYSVIKGKSNNDSRMFSLLQLVGAEDRIIAIDSTDFVAKPMDYSIINENMKEFRAKSLCYLSDSIHNNRKL